MSSNNKTSSLRWAIDELSKQKEDLDAKLNIAHKRDETCILIDEVMAQKNALEQRISALEDGFKSSSELVNTPCKDLEDEITAIDEKLEIAKERLQVIEQEEYLEELGRKLNRSNTEEEIIENNPVDFSDSPSTPIPSKPHNSEEFSKLNQSNSDSHTSIDSSSSELSTSLKSFSSTMKSSSNRILESPQVSENPKLVSKPELQISSSTTNESLEDISAHLGVSPEFLSEKSIQAVLRMIVRNGGKLSFPLEVQQSDL